MKRKFLIIFLAIIAIFSCAFGLTACDGGSGNVGGNAGQGNEQGGNYGGNTTTPDKPKSQYTVTYNANGGTFADGKETFTQNVEEGAILTAPASPTRTASSFGGWTTDKNGKTLWKFASDTVTGNLTLYAVWEEQSAAIISADGATIDEKAMSVFMLVDRNTDSVSLSNKIVCSSDSVWKLYYDKLGQTEIPTKIAAGKLGELSNGDNVFYIVVTSSNGAQVNVYELTIHRSYSVAVSFYDNKDNLIKTDSAYTGYEYKVTYTPNVSGYTFNYWKNENGEEVTQFISYEAVNLYADCTVNTYTATLNVNGGDELDKTENTVTYDKSFSFAVPKRTGYTFTGWYDGSTQVTNSNGKSLNNWAFVSNKTFNAGWQVNSYKVTLNKDLSDGGSVSGDGNYDYDSNVTISATTNNGYTWLGWYDGEILLTQELSYTFKVLDKNVNYVAKWQLYEGLENFIFNSTSSTLTITGIKDREVTSIIVPDYVTSISQGAFSGCSKLESITILFLGENGTSNNNFGYIFGADSYSKNSNYVPESLKTVVITGGTSIGDSAFYYCSSLECVTIPDSVTIIGDSAFYGCSGLTSVTIPDSVTSIGGWAFENCRSLTSVTIPDSVTTIGVSAFYECSSLTIYCEAKNKPGGWHSYWNNSNCPVVWDCKNNDKDSDGYAYTVVNSIRYQLKDSSAEVTRQATNFSGAVEISATITYNEGAYSVTTIDSYAFRGCSSLTSVTIGNSVTSIGSSAFYNCSSLTSITIPDGVTTIGSDVFSGCSSLTSITIPDGVTTIGDYAFYNCSSLTIYCEAGSIPSGWNSSWNYSNRPVVWGYKSEN